MIRASTTQRSWSIAMPHDGFRCLQNVTTSTHGGVTRRKELNAM